MLTKLRALSGSPSMDRLSIEAAGKQICKSVTTPKMWVQFEKKGASEKKVRTRKTG
jgi:hypothetical protein